MYAYVANGEITQIGTLPASARRLDTDEWVMGLATAPLELVEATGWYRVVETPRPDDTATTTSYRTVELIEGVPTTVWVSQERSEEELVAEARAANEQTIRAQAEGRIDSLLLAIDNLQSVLDTANRDITPNHTKQVARETRRTARQVLALTRLMLGALDDTDSDLGND